MPTLLNHLHPGNPESSSRISRQAPTRRRVAQLLAGGTVGLTALIASQFVRAQGVAKPAGSGPAPGATASAAESRIWLTVGQRRFAATLADTAAASAFAALMPLTLDMPDLNGNEKHTTLPKALPVNASRGGNIRSGDLMLYGADTLVVFYLAFETSYSYTRLGRVDNADGLAQALGKGSARITFSPN